MQERQAAIQKDKSEKILKSLKTICEEVNL